MAGHLADCGVPEVVGAHEEHQPSNPDNSPVSKELQEVFHIN